MNQVSTAADYGGGGGVCDNTASAVAAPEQAHINNSQVMMMMMMIMIDCILQDGVDVAAETRAVVTKAVGTGNSPPLLHPEEIRVQQQQQQQQQVVIQPQDEHHTTDSHLPWSLLQQALRQVVNHILIESGQSRTSEFEQVNDC
jgi:hypothetical protein